MLQKAVQLWSEISGCIVDAVMYCNSAVTRNLLKEMQPMVALHTLIAWQW